MTLRPLAALAALAVAATLPAVAHADEESSMLAERGKALRYTKKTPKSGIDTGGAAILVNAPIESARRIITDYRHYDKFIKPFDQSRVLWKKGGVTEVYLQVPILHGAANVWVVCDMQPPVKEADGSERIEAKFVKGNVDDFRAVWRLRAVDDTHTVVKLELLVDPTMPVPGSVVTPELTSAADRAVSAVRKKAEQPAAARAEAGGTANVAGR